jgi:FKBP-type peptidyl-prolyl cis-trans isomerase
VPGKTNIEFEIQMINSVTPKIIFHNDGDGELLPEGVIVYVKYEGRLGTGKFFDENFSKDTAGHMVDVTIPNKQAIEGWLVAL